MNEGIPRRGRARFVAAGLLALAFAAGAFGGVAADRLLDRQAPVAQRTRLPGGEMGGPPGGILFPDDAPLARELDLTPDQRERIRAILQEERAKADSMLREMRPLLQARYDSSSRAIRDVLSPEQRERFDRMREGRRIRMRRATPAGNQ